MKKKKKSAPKKKRFEMNEIRNRDYSTINFTTSFSLV